MRSKTVVVILIVLVCLGLIRVYNSPDENHKYEADLQGTIKAGHWFAWLLFIGNKDWLLDRFELTAGARTKLKEADLQQVFAVEILDKYKVGGGKYISALRSVLFEEPEDIELVTLERQQNYTAMTFKLKEGLITRPDPPGKGGMVYSVVFRYYQPVSESLWKRILRKTANAVPFCSSLGTTEGG